jgi:transcriptional regulator with XRE-family HTH domain
MTLTEWMDSNQISAASLARDLGCGRAYITRVRNGDRPLSLGKAIALYERHKVKLGPIADASPAEIRALGRHAVKQAA